MSVQSPSPDTPVALDTPPAAPAITHSSAPVQIILWTMCFAHFLNDMLQSLLSAILPILKDAYALNFTQVSLIVASFMASASLLQPLVGMATDRRPSPWALSLAMLILGGGLLFLGFAGSYVMILFAGVMIGLASAIFHPEGARVCRYAAGNQLGRAQSTFQVGGNFGQASGPLLAAFVVVPFGQRGIGWFAAVAVIAAIMMIYIGRWSRPHMLAALDDAKRGVRSVAGQAFSRNKVIAIIGILLLLTFSKNFYSASITTFYTFYLMEKFAISLRDAQLYLFLFMGSVAAGVYFGGPLGDRLGRKYVIWFSILGALPFTLMLPYASLFWSAVLTVIIGFIMSASMSQIIVYAMEAVPGRTGLVAGLFFGFAFGMAGLGSAVLGFVADMTSLDFVYKVCAFLPAIGLATIFLPDIGRDQRQRR